MKHLGDNLSEKPEDNNPYASPWINAVGEVLLEKPEDNNPYASPWINAVGDNLQTQSGQGEAFADKNPDLPHNSIAQMLHPYSEISNGDNLRELQAWVHNWDQVYGKSANQKKEIDISFQDNLPKMLAELENILYIPAILEQLEDKSIENLIFIPHRDLHRFPLHALFPDRFVISYLPSVQMGINLSGGSLAADGLSVSGDVGGSLAADGLSVSGDVGGKIDNSSVTSVTKSVAKSVAKLLTIEYPNSAGFHNLPFAEIEAAAITQLFPNHKRIAGENATKTKVTAALTENYDIFHFTGHGNFDTPRTEVTGILNSTSKFARF